MNMQTKELLDKIIKKRNLKYHTIKTYNRSIYCFEEYADKTIPEIIELADNERRQGVLWRESTLKELLENFRREMYNKYESSTGQLYYSKIRSLLNFHNVEMGRIEQIKTETDHLRFVEDIPRREEIQQAINSTNAPVIKAVTLFLSSTGLSPIDALKITIKEYLNTTSEYHHYNIHHDIRKALKEMNDKNNIIPMFIGHRQKSSIEYITFASPEAVKAINTYLLSLKTELKQGDLLFPQHRKSFNRLFAEINDKLELGYTKKGERRFTMKNMRAYHANQLEEAGFNDADINILEGRKNQSILRKHYITVKIESLREKYIRALPYLVIEDINKVKTELENTREELEVKTRENNDLKENLNNVLDRLDSVESRQEAWEELIKQNEVKK